MSEPSDVDALRHVQRQVRVVALLDGAEEAGLTPLPLLDFHNIAFFADALAPVWGLRILDAQLLKQRDGPISPTFQREVDSLVGRGLVRPSEIDHRLDADGAWRLTARYRLNREFADPVLDAMRRFEQSATHLRFAHEIVHAISALGTSLIADAPSADASYGSDVIDYGSIVDIGGALGEANVSAQVAMRFGSLLSEDMRLTSAEMIHFYVRQLYKRMSRVA